MLALNYGARSCFGLFLKPLATEFGVSRGTVSFILSMNMVVYGCLALFTGYLNDRFGPRIVMALGALVSSSAFFFPSVSTNILQVVLLFGVLFGVGTVLLSQITAVSMIVRLPFKSERLTMGLVGSGPGIGNLLLVPIVGYIVADRGWRSAVQTIACLFLLYALLASLALKKNGHDKQLRREIRGRSVIRSILRKRSVILIFFCFFFQCFGVYAVLCHEAAYVTDRGVSVQEAALALSLISATGIIGCPFVGWVAGRFDKITNVGAFFIGLGAVGVLLIDKRASGMWLLLGSILVGVSYCSYMPILPFITKSVVGSLGFGKMWSFVSMGGSLGAALGSWVGGMIFDVVLDYHFLWLSTAACFLAASIMILCVSMNKAFDTDGARARFDEG